MTRRFSPDFLAARAHDILNYYGLEIPELQSGVFIILRGLWVVNPTVDNTRMFFVLRPLVPWFTPGIWSALFMLVGFYQIWALLVDTASHRRRSTLTACMLWMFFGFLSIVSVPQLNTIILFFVFAAENGWSYVRLRDRP